MRTNNILMNCSCTKRSVVSRGAKLLAVAWALFFAQVSHALEPIQHWKTANGARVFYVPAPALPMVDVRVIFSAGGVRDGAHPGLAQLTNGLLNDGAGRKSADEIAQRFEDLGAQYGSGALRDMAYVSLRSLTDPKLLDPALDIFSTVVSKPDFNELDFKRERQRMLVGIQQRAQQPRAITEEAFFQAIYGSHPYASLPVGTEQSVKKLNVGLLRTFYKQFYVANNAVIAIVGDIDRRQAEQLAMKVAGGLSAGKSAGPLPQVADLATASETRIQHPSSQSHVMVGSPGMSRRDKDYFSLYVGNHILGGSGLVSRLSEEIREKRGLSYSAYSYFAPMEKRGPFRLGFQTRNDQVDEALTVLRNTLKEFVENGPSEKELEASLKNITGGFPLRVKSNSDIVEYLGMIGFYELPLDYLETFNDRVSKVTVASIKDAFRRRIDTGRMATIVVGGAK